MKRASQIILMLGIAGAALYIVLNNVAWEGTPAEPGVRDALARVDYSLFGAGMVLFFGLHIGRAIRWGRLIQALRPDVGFRSYFSICSIG